MRSWNVHTLRDIIFLLISHGVQIYPLIGPSHICDDVVKNFGVNACDITT